MIVTHYGHRLPADYDLESIRARARERGPVWDAAADVYFKAFLLREHGRFGASANNFSSLYLWRSTEALRDWLLRGGYSVVTDSFGRAPIETFVALDARRGDGRDARFLYRHDIDIPLDSDLTTAFAGEVDRVRDLATRPGMVSAIVGLDARNWKFVRILLAEEGSNDDEQGDGYQILWLSQPFLNSLRHGEES